MIRTLRAFVWLRWRMLLNSLERTGARDTVERFSLAVERIGPIIAAVMMIPSGLVLAAVGAGAGYALASGQEVSVLFEVVRYLLISVPILSVVGPLFMPAADRTNPVRLLLLPISRGTLYVAQSVGTFADPWILLMLAIVCCLPLGLAAGGAWLAALGALLAGVALTALVLGLSSLATTLLHLVVRDRRRGELLALLFILIIPAVSILPGLLQGSRRQGQATTDGVRRQRSAPAWMARAAERSFAVFPTELYAGATRAAIRGDVAATGRPLLAMSVMAAGLHAVALLAFARVLASPGSTGARRSTAPSEVWGRRLPGLSPGASAVALAQLRLALRTPRGRSILLSPLILVVMFGAIMLRDPAGLRLSGLPIAGGLGLASFASFVSLMSILPIAMNQFAVDRAGLTLALLSPLTDADYLRGKAVGNALISSAPTVVCILLALAVFRDGSLALWISLPLALVSVFTVVAPLAAIISAVFPRVVDLNSIGRGSNAHGVAGLLGLLSFVAAGAPCALIVLAARFLGRPSLTPVFMSIWCAVACGLSWLLFIPARRVFSRRKENLALLRTTGGAS